MISADLYSIIYHQTMLIVVLATSLLYLSGEKRIEIAISLNRLCLWISAATLLAFLGTRPISGVFVDMTTYAVAYGIAAHTGESLFPDPGFALLMTVCAAELEAPVDVFFFTCATIYVLPLAIAMQRVHSLWAFPAFIALAGSFSFFAYGVNGIRHGMATSLLISAFAYSDRRLAMITLMALAASMHWSAILPITIFATTKYIRSTHIGWTIWGLSLGLSATLGASLASTIMALPWISSDARMETYATLDGADKGGFRGDFITYSIAPLALAHLCSSAAMRASTMYRRLLNTYLLTNAFWLCVMYAAFSNRFAYLSWCFLPWLLVFPFVPQRHAAAQRDSEARRSVASLGVVLLGHYAFTYLMAVFVYPARGH